MNWQTQSSLYFIENYHCPRLVEIFFFKQLTFLVTATYNSKQDKIMTIPKDFIEKLQQKDELLLSELFDEYFIKALRDINSFSTRKFNAEEKVTKELFSDAIQELIKRLEEEDEFDHVDEYYTFFREYIFNRMLREEDELLLSALYSKCFLGALRRIISITGGRFNMEKVEELFSDTFLKLMKLIRKGNKFDHENKVCAFLNKYVYYSYMNFIRTSKSKKEVSLEDFVNPDNIQNLKDVPSDEEINFEDYNDPEFSDEEYGLMRKVISELDRIGEPCRTILTYYYLYGIRLKDIAVKLGMSYDAVRKRKQSCLEQIRKRIKETNN